MRISIIIILLLESIFGMAQNSEKKPLIIESCNDSIDISANFYNIYDSLTHYSHPSDVLYNNWNTKRIHYKDENGIVKTDSILIILQDSIHERYFVQPIIGPITSHFGYRRYRFHYGTDIDLVTGDPVKAAMDGMVRITTYERGFGRVIVIRHPNGLETVYAHLSKIKVDTNQIVKAGEVIALGGNTGRSTGSHLHFEIRYLGKAINPETIIDFKHARPINNRFYLTDNNFRYLNRIVANKNAKFHYIRSGDTLSAISRKYHTTISKLCYYNGINQSAILQIGQKLRVR
ncbi:MAG: peptidase M23 [Bacteroidetes bacterium]|nr:MAG: peptidase M23 [Bacteroidota bacterium]